MAAVFLPLARSGEKAMDVVAARSGQFILDAPHFLQDNVASLKQFRFFHHVIRRVLQSISTAWINQSQILEIIPIATTVSGQQACRVNLRVRSDQEIRHNPTALANLAPGNDETSARQEQRCPPTMAET